MKFNLSSVLMVLSDEKSERKRTLQRTSGRWKYSIEMYPKEIEFKLNSTASKSDTVAGLVNVVMKFRFQKKVGSFFPSW
jgi:hypothetical protein